MKKFLDVLLSEQTISTAVAILAVVLILVLIQNLKKNYTKRHMNEKGQKETIVRVIFGILRFIALIFGFLFILQINGINVNGMIAGLGILSAIVGLALQDFIKDIIMGINIISDHFFSVGECVQYNGREGVVLSMTLKTTKIGDINDHSVTTVCNRNISQIVRLGSRMDIDVPISYGESLKDVDKVFSDIASRISKLENVEKCTFEGTERFEASSINYRVRVFCEPRYRADVRRKANREIQNALFDANIKIPFNQLDVHFDK